MGYITKGLDGIDYDYYKYEYDNEMTESAHGKTFVMFEIKITLENQWIIQGAFFNCRAKKLILIENLDRFFCAKNCFLNKKGT